MDQILGSIGDAIGSIVDNPVIQFGFQLFVVYWIVLWLAAAYWAFRDMQLRTENPIAPYLASAFIVIFTPVVFPLAVFTYRIVRPQERIGEVYERNLAEEAMLAEIETIRHCPSCDRRIDADWIICPTCRTRLNRVCPNCSKLVGLDWSLCAWCGKDFEPPELSDVPRVVVTSPTRSALPASSSAPVRVRSTAAVRSTAQAAEAAPAAPTSGRSSSPRSTDPIAES